MNDSRRAKRMKKHHDRSLRRSATLNMVSLMDIFTILVFFLLVNATSSEAERARGGLGKEMTDAQRAEAEKLIGRCQVAGRKLSIPSKVPGLWERVWSGRLGPVVWRGPIRHQLVHFNRL